MTGTHLVTSLPGDLQAVTTRLGDSKTGLSHPSLLSPWTLFRTVHRREGQLACLLPLTPDLSPLALFPQMLSCLEHMYHDLGLVRDYNINPITLRRWLVSDEPTLGPVTSPATPEWATLPFLVAVGFCRAGIWLGHLSPSHALRGVRKQYDNQEETHKAAH